MNTERSKVKSLKIEKSKNLSIFGCFNLSIFLMLLATCSFGEIIEKSGPTPRWVKRPPKSTRREIFIVGRMERGITLQSARREAFHDGVSKILNECVRELWFFCKQRRIPEREIRELLKGSSTHLRKLLARLIQPKGRYFVKYRDGRRVFYDCHVLLSLSRKEVEKAKKTIWRGAQKKMLRLRTERASQELEELERPRKPKERPAEEVKHEEEPKAEQPIEKVESLKDVCEPYIVINSPTSGLKVVSKTIKIDGVVMDDGKIKKVLLNGKEIERTRGVAVIPEMDFPVEDKFIFSVGNFNLKDGVNNIEITAYDEAGHSSKKTVAVECVSQGAALKVRSLPQIWAVIIGVSEYTHSDIPTLKYAHQDAKAFRDFLKSPAGGNVPDDHITLILNKDATSANILGKMNKLLKRAFKNDMVILYFAQHGTPDPDGSDIYFLPYDGDPNNLIGTAISHTRITKITRNIQAGKVIYFIDACHAGGIGAAFALRGGGSEAINQMGLKIAQAKNGVAVFSASTAQQFSREDEKWGGGHGVFTHYLLEGLKGKADLNSDKVITVREAFDYLYRRVGEATEGNQYPELTGTYDDNMPLSILK